MSEQKSHRQQYLYQLLDRLRTDCEYYLGNGNHHPDALWAGNEQGQIAKMKEIWLQLEEKPEWLSWEDIINYASKMGVEELPSTKDRTAEKEINDMLNRNYEKEKKVGLEESYNVSKKEYNNFCKKYDVDPEDYDDVLFTIDELEGNFGDKNGKLQRIREYVDSKINNGIEVLDQTEKEQTAEKPLEYVNVYQTENREYVFMSYDFAKGKINLDDYKLVAKVPIYEEFKNKDELLEYVFTYGNTNEEYYKNNPEARSISMSDILQIGDSENYYVDTFGFVYIGKGDKLTEAEIHTNQNSIDLEKEKEDIQKQLDDVEELQAKKKELNDKVDELFEESKEIKTENMSKEDIMACYISDIVNYAYTYRHEAAQEEINATLEDLKNDKDLDNLDKAMVIRFVRSTLLDRDIKFEDPKYYEQPDEIIEENKDIEHTQDYIDFNKELDELIANNATDKELNDFLEEVSFNEVITHNEYLALQKKAQNIRMIDILGESKEVESFKIGDRVKIVNSNKLHNDKQGEITFIDDEIFTVKLDNGRSFNYDKNQVQKIEEDIKNDLGIESGSKEEAQLDELTDRNLAEEFKALTKEQQQEYLDCIPENKKGLSREVINELAEKYNLDDTLLYWVVNIKGVQEDYEKLEEDNFPSTDATKKELTPIELRQIKLDEYLTDEQKDYVINNIDTIDNIQNHLEKLGNYYAQFRDDFQEEEIISIDEYLDAYKNEFKKGSN